MAEDEELVYDVLIVGGGPSGLATAIHLKQLALTSNQTIKVALIEKGSEIGAHIISGCIMDPRAIDELIPQWRQLNFPISTLVKTENLYFLNSNSHYSLMIPKAWNNQENYIISLSQLCRALGSYAESLGVEIYTGFAGMGPIIEANSLKGIITGAMGLNKDGTPSINYQPGIKLIARQTVLAEGCRGSLTQTIIKKFKLDINSSLPTYALGIKEIWRCAPSAHQEGKVIHTIGYPLNRNIYGGGFLYHLANNLVAVGLITALNYKNPYLNPYEEFQKFKAHPLIAKTLTKGERIEYGARVINEGGILALPQLSFSGGVIVGDGAGFVNVAKLKGVDNALKSGILAAEGVIVALNNNQSEAKTYTALVKKSYIHQELYKVRNIRPAFNYGLYWGLLYGLIDHYIFRGKTPWSIKIKQADHEVTLAKNQVKAITYPVHDHRLSFDQTSSLQLANLYHEDNQPCHLLIKDQASIIKINYYLYDAPETKFCPAGVYQIVTHVNTEPELIIQPQNCVHCKACDIKDYQQIIQWIPPQGGSGPQYSVM